MRVQQKLQGTFISRVHDPILYCCYFIGNALIRSANPVPPCAFFEDTNIIMRKKIVTGGDTGLWSFLPRVFCILWPCKLPYKSTIFLRLVHVQKSPGRKGKENV